MLNSKTLVNYNDMGFELELKLSYEFNPVINSLQHNLLIQLHTNEILSTIEYET